MTVEKVNVCGSDIVMATADSALRPVWYLSALADGEVVGFLSKFC